MGFPMSFQARGESVASVAVLYSLFLLPHFALHIALMVAAGSAMDIDLVIAPYTARIDGGVGLLVIVRWAYVHMDFMLLKNQKH